MQTSVVIAKEILCDFSSNEHSYDGHMASMTYIFTILLHLFLVKQIIK